VVTVSLKEGIKSGNFSSDCATEAESVTPQTDGLSAGQFDRSQRLKEWEEYARARLAAKMKEIRSKQREYAPVQAPPYDDVFFEGMAAMDESDGIEIPLGRYVKIED
jgi:hypothetical protein